MTAVAKMSARMALLMAILIFTSVITAQADLALKDCAESSNKLVKTVFKTEGEIKLPCSASNCRIVLQRCTEPCPALQMHCLVLECSATALTKIALAWYCVTGRAAKPHLHWG